MNDFFNRRFPRQITAIVLILAFLFSCVLSPNVYAFPFGSFTLKDEKELGRKYEVMIKASMPVIEDPEISGYIKDLLRRIVRAVPPQPFEFKSSVILHNSLNAFAVPGGNIFVFSGMIMNLDSEDQLAGIMAHELAHVTQRHVASRMERAQALSLGSLLVALAGIALAGPAGAPIAATALGAGQSAMLNYSRLDESEADNIGLQYLIAAGYPPIGMVGGFKLLRQKSWISGVSVPTYLSTHPAIGDRVNSMSARIAALPEKTRGKKFDNSRFKRVQTLLWARYGDEQAALQRFSASDPLSLMGRGIVLSRQNKVNEAAKAFDLALNKKPDDALILREAGIFHFRKGDMGKAENLLLKAMRHDPRDYMATFFYGRMLDETGRGKQAPKYYRDVLRYVPQEPEVHEALAKSLGHAGDTCHAYIHLAYSAIFANNRKQAQRYFKQAEAVRSQDEAAFKRLETAYKERKEIWDKS